MNYQNLTTRFHIESCVQCGGEGGRVHPTQAGWQSCEICGGTGQIEMIDVERKDNANDLR
jgi:DnaJ-class molecular chaperone